MGVSKNRGTPKWMVYNGKPYFLMDDLGVFPLFLETPKSKTKELKTWDFAQVFSIQASSDVGLAGFSDFGERRVRWMETTHLFRYPTKQLTCPLKTNHIERTFQRTQTSIFKGYLSFQEDKYHQNKWWMFNGYVSLRECIWSWMAEKIKGRTYGHVLNLLPFLSTSEGWKDLQNNRKGPNCCYRRIWQHRIDLDCLNKSSNKYPKCLWIQNIP